jgi:hypothetical protein
MSKLTGATSSSTPSPDLGHLDSAILDRIFAVLAPKKSAPHKRLVPCLRVNKHWHAAGRSRLYGAIAPAGPWVARPLRRTLQINKGLAALVTELVLDTELGGQSTKETLDHVQIVEACPNLKHLTVLGYASDDVGRYRAAIASRRGLVSLNVSEGAGMFEGKQLLGMMLGWPRLEKLILKNALLPPAPAPASASSATPVASSHTPAFASTTPAKAPIRIRPNTLLKMVKIIDTLDTKTLSFTSFAALAPAVSVLWVESGKGVRADDLLAALRAWAPSLEVLCLLCDGESEFFFPPSYI